MKLKIALFAILILLVVFLYPQVRFVQKDLHISFLRTIFSFRAVEKFNNQTNILILGKPGGSHDGPDLTDSIMLVNYNFRSNKLTTIGFPRDIWSDTLTDKINSAYAYGEAKKPGNGLVLAKAEIAKLSGLPIQYALIIDFSEFKDLINFLGGVDINVERSFTDKKFPIEGKENDECGGDDEEFLCRYETISFHKGKAHMDGETALKFVRSRNAIGEEGSDFARSKRQQLVMEAVKGRIIRTILRFNLDNNKKLYALLDKSVKRDISNQQIAVLAKKAILRGGIDQKNEALPRELFDVPDVSVYGKYVLVGKNNDPMIIKKYTNCLVEHKSTCNSLL